MSEIVLPPLPPGEGRGEGALGVNPPPSSEHTLPPPATLVSSRGEREQSLREQIKEDYIAHGRDWTKPGFRAVAVHRFGVWRMTVRSKLLRAPLSMIYRHLYRKCRNHYGIELPYSARIGRRVVIEHQGAIVIHGNSEIDDDSIIRQSVTLGNKSLDKPFDAPKLGKRVNVGAGAKILGAVVIGDDATIGANAVIVKNVPARGIAVGIPGQIVGFSPASASDSLTASPSGKGQG